MVDMDEEDLYLWLDPISMLSMSKIVYERLIQLYPDQKNQMQANMKELEIDLINLDSQYQALATSLLNENKKIQFVSMSASFGNWQKAYGFEVYPVLLSKYGVLPNEKQLTAIKSRILKDNVQYIVYEPNMTEEMIALFNELEEELSLIRVELNNLSTLSALDDEAGKDYLSIMYENLGVLETMKIDRNTPEGEGE